MKSDIHKVFFGGRSITILMTVYTYLSRINIMLILDPPNSSRLPHRLTNLTSHKVDWLKKKGK